jgi:oligopeptide/dipeptide ABC transporter ATP-binding protein
VEAGRETLIEVRDLDVSYASGGRCRHALSGVSLDVRAGEVVGVLGESGAGKTSLGLALMRLLPPSARIERGSIRFQGRDLLAIHEPAMQKIRGVGISMIFQEPELALNPCLSAARHVEEVLAAHRGWDRQKRQEEALRALAAVGLTTEPGLPGAYPHQLSGGQRQRLVMAVALACGPAAVVADEPTASLDAVLQAEWQSWMKQMRSEHGIALLLITHDPSLLAGWADRVLVLYAGRIVEEGAFEEVTRRPLHPYTEALLRSIPPHPGAGAGTRKRLPEIGGASVLPAAGCPFAPRCPDRLPVCAQREPPVFAPEGARRVRCFKYGE